jgi:hypothetical protein
MRRAISRTRVETLGTPKKVEIRNPTYAMVEEMHPKPLIRLRMYNFL